MGWMKIVCTILCIFLLLVSIDGGIAQSIHSMNVESESLIDKVVFPHDEVIDVYIDLEEDSYHSMLKNAMSEETVIADITYNGYSFNSVGIRPKGNSSLRSVANSGSDRYSLNVDLNYYLDEQNFYGITEINLNNCFSDPSMIAEYIGYEMLNELDAVASRTTYAALYINGEYKGLYLCVEQVDEAFLKHHYGNANGELYKPEMGAGSDLEYISDNGLDYTGLEPKNSSSKSNTAITKLIKSIEDGDDLENILNVDSFLKYLAMSTVTVHLDSYQSGMFHNYYLYNNNGIFEWISWDLNMIFNGFPMSGLTDKEAAEFLIDEPVIGTMDNYPIIEAIFKNEDYVTRYHNYIKILIDGYCSETQFSDKVIALYEMIKDYVEIDPTSFYTYNQFEEALFQDTDEGLSLLSFVSQRSENITEQLGGVIPSTNNGQGNKGSEGKGMRNDRNMGSHPNRKGNLGDGMENMMGDLPPGVSIEDLPEELRTYFENGEMPPRDKMMELMDYLPEELIPFGKKKGQGQKTNEGVLNKEENLQANKQAFKINIGLLSVLSLGMISFSHYLKKK